jgi:hypothetical protein
MFLPRNSKESVLKTFIPSEVIENFAGTDTRTKTSKIQNK